MITKKLFLKVLEKIFQISYYTKPEIKYKKRFYVTKKKKKKRFIIIKDFFVKISWVKSFYFIVELCTHISTHIVNGESQSGMKFKGKS